jgi:hypothetical protein
VAIPRWTAAVSRRAGRHRRQGDRAQRFRRDEGLALGEGRCQHEGIPIINFHVPKTFEHHNGKLLGMTFEVVRAVYDDKGGAAWYPPASRMCWSNATRC